MSKEDHIKFRELKSSQITPESRIQNERLNKLMHSLSTIPHIELPVNKAETGILRKGLQKAMSQEQISLYIGSCPDYSHSNGKYDHQYLGEEIPLLSSLHLQISINTLKTLDFFGVDYEMVLMLADVEATDEYFVKKFANGSEQEFLRRCNVSKTKTALLIENIKLNYGILGTVRSSSFFQEFGRQNYINTMNSYLDSLYHYFENDSHFQSRVLTDTLYRDKLYEKMYPDYYQGSNYLAKTDFLNSRTLRTMAQYLALGKLISEKTANNAVIIHPTVNSNIINIRNRFRTSEESPQLQHPTIPILKMNKEVY